MIRSKTTNNPLNCKSDQHLVLPSSITAGSFVKIMRINEMIVNLRSSLIVQKILLVSTHRNALVFCFWFHSVTHSLTKHVMLVWMGYLSPMAIYISVYKFFICLQSMACVQLFPFLLYMLHLRFVFTHVKCCWVLPYSAYWVLQKVASST